MKFGFDTSIILIVFHDVYLNFHMSECSLVKLEGLVYLTNLNSINDEGVSYYAYTYCCRELENE